MSLPRHLPLFRIYLISRRTSERRFFLRPSKKIRQICFFCLAYAAWRTGMQLHAFAFLSNHFHIVATDTEARLPEFMHWLDQFIAKCVNSELGRRENIWAPGSFNAVHLVDAGAVVKELEYTFNNPVGSGLVPRMKDWPGAFSTPADMERPPRMIDRPEGFFRDNGPVPKSVALVLTAPEQMGMTVAQLVAFVAEREHGHRQTAIAEGRTFLGRRQVLKQSPHGRPRTHEARGRLNPRVAAQDKSKRIEALQLLRDFVAAYAAALERFVSGDRAVVFPYGTYGMRVRFGAACHGP